jgi:pimeloyl-ACP methyl ester carboxylesterase
MEYFSTKILLFITTTEVNFQKTHQIKASILINNQMTDILEYGCHINQETLDKVIVIIPGNPGVTDFYDSFAKKLHFTLKIPVIVVGYLGHSFEHTELKTFSIHEQMEHKYQFLQFLIQKHPKISIYLAGHSIGAWVGVQILGRDVEQITQFFGLFPTISNLNLSENGQHLFYKLVVRNGIRNLFSLGAHAASFLPKPIRLWIAEFIKKESELEPYVIQSLFNYKILNNVFYMAGTEFNDIREANYDIIDKYQSKIQFYYGDIDHWVPQGFNQIMKKKYPNIVTIDDQENKHAFVIYKKGIDTVVNFMKKLIK